MKQPNIVFKSLLDKIKGIEKRNKYFDYLSAEGKRLEIAWDCLKLIQAKQVKAIGVCVGYWDSTLFDETIDKDSKKLQRILCNIKSCKVCARGGVMLSQIRLGNHISGNDEYRDMGNDKNLSGFSMDNMEEMESEYEHGYYSHPYKPGSTEKLMNIMCNILVNGNFNKNDKTDYLI